MLTNNGFLRNQTADGISSSHNIPAYSFNVLVARERDISLLEVPENLVLELVSQARRRLGLLLGSFRDRGSGGALSRSALLVFGGNVFVTSTAATGVVVQVFGAEADSGFGNHNLVGASRGRGAGVANVAGASSSSAVGAITMASLRTKADNLAINVLGVVDVDVAGAATAVGYFSGHRVVLEGLENKGLMGVLYRNVGFRMRMEYQELSAQSVAFPWSDKEGGGGGRNRSLLTRV